MIYLGIDWGEKRIGLALGDSETRIATPFKVVAGMSDIFPIIKEEEIDIIVIGKPYSISNSKFKISKEFSYFLNTLKEKTGVQIFTVDERLTSKAADALVGNKKTKAARDSIAAMLILQSYLDREHL